MFDNIFKKKPETEEPKVTEEPELEVTEKPEKPSRKAKKTRKPAKAKPAEAAEDADLPVYADADLKAAENEFVGIKEYGSAVEIAEKIDDEIAAAKSALGDCLRRLDNVRAVAEKSKRLRDIVSKVAGKKQVAESAEQIEVNGLEIVLDATPLNELTAIESVVRSHQQRLMDLQKAKEALAPLDQFGDTEGIRYLVLEKEGIPEQILLKIS
jgi:hypothetical protein